MVIEADLASFYQLSLDQVMGLSLRRVYTLVAGLLSRENSGLSRAVLAAEDEGWQPVVSEPGAGKVVSDPDQAARLLEQVFAGAQRRRQVKA